MRPVLSPTDVTPRDGRTADEEVAFQMEAVAEDHRIRRLQSNAERTLERADALTEDWRWHVLRVQITLGEQARITRLLRRKRRVFRTE